MNSYLDAAIPLGALVIAALGFLLATIDLTDVGESRAMGAIERALATVVGLPRRALALVVREALTEERPS